MVGETLDRYKIESKLAKAGRALLFTRVDSSVDDLMLAENFR